MDVLRKYMSEVRVPTRNDAVYRTEGVFTYENPEFTHGLYVSLSTFQSYARESALSISGAQANSHVYLNIKVTKTKKETPPTATSDKEEKPTIMAIGVEGGFQTEEDLYDIETKYSVVVLPDDVSFAYPDENLPEVVRQSVESVLKLEDAGKMRELQAWVEERSVSKFAKDLPQLDNGVKISPNPEDWKCADSGMTENLWLNLSTGHIGSGRQNWDGSGGTGAALKHFEDTGSKYPLVVKLGTITPNGADVYSYDPSENDMVEDPYLAQHLAHWGINMVGMHKTEKTMAELSIDLNMKYEFDAIQESGAELEPLHGPHFMGLRNLGNSCYMNSLLQVLFSVPQVQDRYVGGADSIFSRASDNAARSLEVQLAKLGVALCTDRYCGDNVPTDFVISPQMLRTVIGSGHPEFSSNRQQDVLEYYQHLMELIGRDDRGRGTDAASIVQLFTFAVEERLECLQSHQVRYTCQKGLNALCLELPLDTIVNHEEINEYYAKTDDNKRTKLCDANAPAGIIEFERCVEKFLLPRLSDGFLSPVTGQRGGASVSSRIQRFPPYLMIQLRRYVLGEDWTPKKLNVVVDMPLTYDFGVLRARGKQEDEQELPNEDTGGGGGGGVQPDEVMVGQLLSFGMFSENGCRRAAVAVNNSSVEAAVNWGVEHMGDADFNDPLSPSGGGGGGGIGGAVNAESLMMLESMGFQRKHAEKALRATNGDVGRATEWLFSRADNLDDDGAAAKDEDGVDTGDAHYDLCAIISHMGPSTHSGHYVCHIRNDDGWAIFNDRKVAKSEKPPFGLGFLYLYRRRQ